MNFDFSEEQFLLRDSVRDFLADHWSTKALRAAGGKPVAALWDGLSGLGLQTLLVPEVFGGAGLGMVDAVMVFEEFGRALVPGPMLETILAGEIIARYAPEEMRLRLLPLLAGGRARVAFAHAEPNPSQDPAYVTVGAIQDGTGWRLSGRKILVAAAESATGLIVSARLPDSSAGLFLVELPADGVAVARHTAIDPDSMLCRVDFDRASASLIGGQDALLRLLATSAVAAAAQMIGVAGAALEQAVAYAKQRVQFDRPIGSFQAIKHKCADMLMAAETARYAAYYAAWAVTEDDPGQDLAVSIAKAACGDACRLVCNDALQIHGGVGFTWEFDVHLFMKRGKLLEYSFGDATWHRERVARLILPV